MISNILTSEFLMNSLIPISLFTLPILVVAKATPFRSFMAASVIYFVMILLTACNIQGPF
jgi:hypothetical protein